MANFIKRSSSKLGDEVIIIIGCTSVSIICKSPGGQILHTALRGAELCGGGGEGGDPIRFDPPVRDRIFLRKARRPSAGVRDRKTTHWRGNKVTPENQISLGGWWRGASAVTLSQTRR